MGLIAATLVGCGKPLKRPELPGPNPKENSIQNLVLGKNLSVSDLKTILRGLNEKGEFNNLVTWLENLTPAQSEQWADFVNHWAYEDALSSKGLIQILKKRVEQKSFSKSLTKLNEFLEKYPEARASLPALSSDPNFFLALKRLSSFLEPDFESEVLTHYFEGTKSYKENNDFPKADSTLFKNEILGLFSDKGRFEKLKSSWDAFVSANAIPALIAAGRENLKSNGERGFSDLAKSISRSAHQVGKALRLAHLLNRPADKIISTLREGLRSNPDAIQALSIKWDPVLVRTLSKSLRKVLLKPEDGIQLDKAFWMGLARSSEAEGPTPQFIRLYSIIYSGIQKLGDPRRLEPDQDSGSYRLNFQLNALFLTRWLEKVAREEKPNLQGLSEIQFENGLWSLLVKDKNYRLALSDESSPKSLNPTVRKDLEALELDSLIQRLESLVLLEDSGRNSYSLAVESESATLEEMFSEAVNEAHRVRPFTDITPLLVSLVQDVIAEDRSNGFSLEILEHSSNILNQVQGLVAGLEKTQWHSLKQILFEDLKIGQLELEDRMLILGLFQSDPEVAEWVNEVLVNLQSIYLLDESTGMSLFEFYRTVVKHLSASELQFFSNALGEISELSLFNVSEEEKGLFPGVLSYLMNPRELTQILRGLSALSVSHTKLLQKLLFDVFGQNELGETGTQVLLDWIQPHAKLLVSLYSWFLEADFSLLGSLSRIEKKWLLEFIQEGGLDRVKELPSVISELRALTDKKVISQGMSLLSRMQDERMREIAKTIYHWDLTGELKAFFEMSEITFHKGEKP